MHRRLGIFFTAALAERNVLDAGVKLVAALGEDPEVLKVLSDLTVKVLAEQNVIDATNELFAAASEKVLGRGCDASEPGFRGRCHG